MNAITAYRLRLERKRLGLRARRKAWDLAAVRDRTDRICAGQIIAASVLRNEMIRLPYFLEYYRRLGVGHFLLVDNGSDDGTGDYLARQRDVSLWRTDRSYRRARYGVDWLNALAARHAHGHWLLTVDADEFLVYPFCDTRPLAALTDWLDVSEMRSLGAMLLDMYPRGRLDAEPYVAGQNPFEIAEWFDAGNYTVSLNHRFRNLWIQGGPRARAYFSDAPNEAPALNKIPLVRWDRSYAYVSSTHMLLPRKLNKVYDRAGGERISGLLLHAKFLDTFQDGAAVEADRAEHFRAGAEYRAYADAPDDRVLWCSRSERYLNWRQLEIMGLMSKGNWA